MLSPAGTNLDNTLASFHRAVYVPGRTLSQKKSFSQGNFVREESSNLSFFCDMIPSKMTVEKVSLKGSYPTPKLRQYSTSKPPGFIAKSRRENVRTARKPFRLPHTSPADRNRTRLHPRIRCNPSKRSCVIYNPWETLANRWQCHGHMPCFDRKCRREWLVGTFDGRHWPGFWLYKILYRVSQ